MTSTPIKNVVLLGATGSIGQSTLQVIRAHPDRLRLCAVAAHSNTTGLAEICDEFNVPHAALADEQAYAEAKKSKQFPSGTTLISGEGSLEALCSLDEAEIVLVAVVGACGLRPALAAIEAGKDIALANKELLVLGGKFVIEAAKRKNVRLLPTDSEHNAIFQCIDGHPTRHIEKLILTASGGQFRDQPLSSLASVTPIDATQHPNWSMGPKITVDSSTMANKGLELIEAHWLFGLAPENLEVVIHPQSIVHSFAQFIDGSILAQLCPPSMTFAIQHCLLYPERAAPVESTLNFKDAFSLDFKAPDFSRYPCLKLAYDSLTSGGIFPAVFNAANEIAVERFLASEIRYLDIPNVIETTLSQMPRLSPQSLDTLIEADAEARKIAKVFCHPI